MFIIYRRRNDVEFGFTYSIAHKRNRAAIPLFARTGLHAQYCTEIDFGKGAPLHLRAYRAALQGTALHPQRFDDVETRQKRALPRQPPPARTGEEVANFRHGRRNAQATVRKDDALPGKGCRLAERGKNAASIKAETLPIIFVSTQI